jgi:mannose-6-phosphate isomerase-like protein (cupin superfamily)
MTSKVRRVVTGEGSDGQSCVLGDIELPVTAEMPNLAKVYYLMRTEGEPQSVPLTKDLGAKLSAALEPQVGGTQISIAYIEPAAKAGSAAEGDQSIPMHKTDTIDCAVVMSGELTLVLDQEEVELSPGDCIVQGGVDHTWINRGQETCVLLMVMVGAVRS